jgi:tetratricopeptide (TPR) repeat protein
VSYADLLARGYAARRANDRQTALASFKQAMAIDPRDIRARLEIAAELREMSRLDEAEVGYQAVLAEQPNQLQALLGLGYCARRRGDRVAALAHFQAAAARTATQHLLTAWQEGQSRQRGSGSVPRLRISM